MLVGVPVHPFCVMELALEVMAVNWTKTIRGFTVLISYGVDTLKMSCAGNL